MIYYIIIDAQNDFITGPFGSDETKKVKKNILKELSSLKEERDYVIFTMDEHDENYKNTLEAKKYPTEHCIRGTFGYDIDSEIYDKTFNIYKSIIHKQTYGSSSLTEFFRNKIKENDKIYIMGFTTDVCVISNALMLRSVLPNTNIYVMADCCAGTTKENHKKALDIMENCGIPVIKTIYTERKPKTFCAENNFTTAPINSKIKAILHHPSRTSADGTYKTYSYDEEVEIEIMEVTYGS